jgi:hypothetical protein
VQTYAELEAAFSSALELHCRQASKIVESFAGGWHSKALFEKNLTEERGNKEPSAGAVSFRAPWRPGSAERDGGARHGPAEAPIAAS